MQIDDVVQGGLVQGSFVPWVGVVETDAPIRPVKGWNFVTQEFGAPSGRSGSRRFPGAPGRAKPAGGRATNPEVRGAKPRAVGPDSYTENIEPTR